jgi:hypothetical protein
MFLRLNIRDCDDTTSEVLVAVRSINAIYQYGGGDDMVAIHIAGGLVVRPIETYGNILAHLSALAVQDVVT